MAKNDSPIALTGAQQFLAITIFAASGGSALVYQSIWSQYLGLYLGHAAYAQCLVLAIFMGGLALGAWITSRRSGAWSNLLAAYALVELLLSALALLFHPIYLATTEFSYNTLLPAAGTSVGALVKWISGACLILPQSILLGMTFPLMSNGLIRASRSLPGRIIGILYFANSFGAAVGALLSTFLFLPWVGLPGSMRIGGCIGLAVSLIAFLLARQTAGSHGLSYDRDNRAQLPRLSATAPSLLLAAAFVTGATSFVYEIVWVRMLSLVFGTTLHSFELMLTAFIGGLAVGGWAVSKRIDRFRNLVQVAAYVQIAMGLAALATMMLYGQSFHWAAYLMRALSRTSQGYDLFNVATATVAILIMCPAAFFAGMTLPIFSLELTRTGNGEAAIGRIYAANTFGAIVGVVISVVCLIPFLGLKLSMMIAAFGDISLGLVLARSVAGADRRRYLATLGSSGVLAAIFLLLSPFDRRELASGVFRTGSARIPENAAIPFYRDGATASVSVGELNGIRLVATNGKSDSAIQMIDGQPPTEDELTMILAAVLPVAYNPKAKRAAVVGIGTGLTSNTLLGVPTLDSVDTIEIEPAMEQASRLFGKYSSRVFSDTRSRIYFEDARVFFSERGFRYDIIVSEPSNPWVTGVANLFTSEFYRHVKKYLADDGIFVQWVQQYEISDELVATICNALSDEFSDYRLYLSNDADLLIVATPRPMLPAVDPRVLEFEKVKESLAHVSIRSATDISLHEIGAKRSLDVFLRAETGVRNSDFHPVLSLEAPRARFASKGATALHSLLDSDLPLLEMIQERMMRDSGYSSVGRNFSISFEVSAAHEIVNRWRDPAAPGKLMDDHIAATIVALKNYTSSCAASSDERAILAWMYEIETATIPYLNSQELADFRSENWKHCEFRSPAAVAFGYLLDALIARDADAIQKSSSDLLRNHRESLKPEIQDFVLRSSLLGNIANGRPDLALDLVNTAGRDIQIPESRAAERAYLRSYALGLIEQGASTHH